MYSDFVGVTYNKTHAKYQACITHYRKQHYLGRYKLAVDAALAYDESARLLKGSSWKVNFQKRQDYEEAKQRELESVGKMGAADVAGSLAAVALKIQEIASNVGQKGTFQKILIGSSDDGVDAFRGQARISSVLGIVGMNAQNRTSKCHAATGVGVKSTPIMSKVTPSPTSQMCSLPEKQELASLVIPVQRQSAETPLPSSPNPTRHTMGNEKRTPDSAIRPKILTYKHDVQALHSDTVDSRTVKPSNELELDLKNYTHRHTVRKKVDLGSSIQSSSLDPHPSIVPGLERPISGVNLLSSSRSPRAAPPVIQNGTLAAASALMTLFGNEYSPQG